MLLSDAIKKPSKKASKQTSTPASSAPRAASQSSPAPTAAPPRPIVPSAAEVTSFLRNMTTKTTRGPVQEVRLERLEDVLRYVQPSMASEIRALWKESWTVTPWGRQRLDHYVGSNYHPGPDDDPEGWDSEGWEEDYAGPLEREVQAKLDARFGKGLFSVGIGEKGHIEVSRT